MVFIALSNDCDLHFNTYTSPMQGIKYHPIEFNENLYDIGFTDRGCKSQNVSLYNAHFCELDPFLYLDKML